MVTDLRVLCYNHHGMGRGAAESKAKVQELEIKWNCINLVTNGPQQYGHINRMATIMGFFKEESD